MNTRRHPHMFAALATVVALAVASIGAAAAASAATDTVSVSGVVWDDTNKDGVRDPGEPGIPDLGLAVVDPDGNVVMDPAAPWSELTVTTDADGAYAFPELPVVAPGQAYTVALLWMPDGYASTTGLEPIDGGYLRPTEADLSTPGASDTAVDFALAVQEAAPTVTVGGDVWDDLDHDGTRDIGEPALSGLTLTVSDPDLQLVRDPADPLQPLRVTTDAYGEYYFDHLPVLPGGAHYTVTLEQGPAGYVSTEGLEPSGGGFQRATTTDLSVADAFDFGVHFALAAGDGSDPGGGGGDPGGGADWLVMPILHGDVLYPEVDTAEGGAQTLQLRAHIDTYQPMDWDDLVIHHTDAIKETLPQHYTPSADYSFIGPEGSTVYRSRNEGPVPDGSPWIGAATQSPTLDIFAPDHPFSFRLDAVTGYQGGAAPGDVVLWQSFAPATGQVLLSTKTALPQALVFGKGKHTHFNWSFTQPGIYCMAFSVRTEMPDGSRQLARGILTQIVGSQYDPTTIEPCGRHLAYPAQPAKPVVTGADQAPVISGDNHAAFSLALDSQQRLRATYEESGAYADAPATTHSIDDVILYGKSDINYPYRFTTGNRGGRNLSWDTVRIGDAALDGDITWKIDSIAGPGDLLTRNSGEWSDQKFDTANGVMSQTLWAGSAGNWRNPRWEVSRPGKYCVAMTWSAKTADGTTTTDHHVLTLVADGPLDPNDYDPYTEAGSPYAGQVWRAADHGALDKTCAQGGTPTSPDEVPAPGDDGGGPQPWDVPNWSRTDSGALILNDGHIDIASTLDGDTLATQVKDTTTEGQIHATHDGASWHDPSTVVLQLRPDSETAVPASDGFGFLGQAGKPVWIVAETQQPDLLWPGWSTEAIPEPATTTGFSWRLNRMSGPGEFALYRSGQALGTVDVLYNTRDGITAADSFEIPKRSHVHGSWAFSAEGTYCLGFTRSTTLANGKKASNPFTLAVAVGKADVTKVDPSTCFATPGKPGSPDTTPVPESHLTAATAGGVQVLDGQAGFNPGQLVTVRVGTSHAGEWVSVWLHSTPTWLGWQQVTAAGTVRVRLPVGAATGSHKIVVESRTGELIGWAALRVVRPAKGGGSSGPGGGDQNSPTGDEPGATPIASTGQPGVNAPGLPNTGGEGESSGPGTAAGADDEVLPDDKGAPNPDPVEASSSSSSTPVLLGILAALLAVGGAGGVVLWWRRREKGEARA